MSIEAFEELELGELSRRINRWVDEAMVLEKHGADSQDLRRQVGVGTGIYNRRANVLLIF